MRMAVYIQLLHLRNCKDCSMFTPQANMKMTLTEITTGNSGNGNSDILKEELIQGGTFQSNLCVCVCIMYYYSFTENNERPVCVFC
jgi:hypothetical protein